MNKIDMKNLVLLILTTISVNTYGQKDTITTAVKNPLGIVNSDNYLFIAEADDNEITKIDLTIQNPIPVAIISGFSRPNFLTVVGNFLYFTEYYENRISKIDLTQTFPKPTIVVSGLNTPEYLKLNGNDLYFSEFNAGKISKIDITHSNPIPTTVISGLNTPYGLEINGNDLFYSEFSGNKISKIDITQVNPKPTIVINDISGPLGGMKIKGNKLYFFEYQSRKISMIDITSSTPTVKNIDVDVAGGDIEFIGNDMYISDFENNLILKYSNQIVSISNVINPSFEIFPNPSSDFISIKGVVEKMSGTIFNFSGVKIQEFTTHDNETLDISFLNPGTYFVVFTNGVASKFIKKWTSFSY